MPSRQPYLVYWDACCVLRLVNKHPDWWEILQTLVARSQDKEDTLRILTSTLSLTEVAFGANEQRAADGKRVLDDTELGIIDAFWAPGGPIDLAEYSATVGRKARSVIRQTGGKVKGFDAVHVATALTYGVDEMNTFDDAILNAPLTDPLIVREPKADIQTTLFTPDPPGSDTVGEV